MSQITLRHYSSSMSFVKRRKPTTPARQRIHIDRESVDASRQKIRSILREFVKGGL